LAEVDVSGVTASTPGPVATETTARRLLPEPTECEKFNVVPDPVPVVAGAVLSRTIGLARRVATETRARRLLPEPTLCDVLRLLLVPDPVSAVAELSNVTAPVESRFDDTDTIAILSLPEPTVWLQLRLLAPASAVFELETPSNAIGNNAGLRTLVRSTVIVRR
jgi:hypothetical protein